MLQQELEESGKKLRYCLLHRGAVAVGGKNVPCLCQTVKEIQEVSPESRGYEVELGNKENVEQVGRQILEDFGGIDILVNTVGINDHGRVDECTEEQVEKMISVN